MGPWPVGAGRLNGRRDLRPAPALARLTDLPGRAAPRHRALLDLHQGWARAARDRPGRLLCGDDVKAGVDPASGTGRALSQVFGAKQQPGELPPGEDAQAATGHRDGDERDQPGRAPAELDHFDRERHHMRLRKPVTRWAWLS